MNRKESVSMSIDNIKDFSAELHAYNLYRAAKILRKSHSDDFDKYFDLLNQAAEGNNHTALFTLAYHYYYGEYIDRDVDKALNLCKKASKMIENQTISEENGLFIKTSKIAYQFFYRYMKRMTPKTPSKHYMIVYNALTTGYLSLLEPLLDKNVVYSNIFHEPLVGIKNIIAWFKKISLDNTIRVSFIATERYGTVVELYRNYPAKPALVIIRVNEQNLIDRIAAQPISWGPDTDFNGYYYNVGSKPLPWKHIRLFLEKNTLQYESTKVGGMYCMKCGKLSEDLTWINYHTKPDQFSTAEFGVMSVCPDCKQMVEFRPHSQEVVHIQNNDCVDDYFK